MSSSAPYQLNIAFDAGATFAFSLAWEMADGTPFPWADYLVSYALAGGDDWCPSTLFTLNQASGISTDPLGGSVTFKNTGVALQPGRYSHACRVTHVSGGEVITVFDGSVTINRDAFQ